MIAYKLGNLLYTLNTAFNGENQRTLQSRTDVWCGSIPLKNSAKRRAMQRSREPVERLTPECQNNASLWDVVPWARPPALFPSELWSEVFFGTKTKYDRKPPCKTYTLDYIKLINERIRKEAMTTSCINAFIRQSMLLSLGSK